MTTDEKTQREPEEVALLTRAFDHAKKLFPLELRESWAADRTVELTDDQALAAGFGLLGSDMIRARRWPPESQACGWCVRAAGDTQEAYDKAERHSYEDVCEHAQVCEHNPVVVSLRAAEAKLEAIAEALGRDDDDHELALKEIARLRAREVEKIDAMVEAESGRVHMLADELAEHFPIAITARAMLNDEATIADLREIVDVIGNGDAELRRTYLSPRLRKLVDDGPVSVRSVAEVLGG